MKSIIEWSWAYECRFDKTTNGYRKFYVRKGNLSRIDIDLLIEFLTDEQFSKLIRKNKKEYRENMVDTKMLEKLSTVLHS